MSQDTVPSENKKEIRARDQYVAGRVKVSLQSNSQFLVDEVKRLEFEVK